MAIGTATGSKFYIGTTEQIAEDDQAAYEAETYTEVGEVESLGEFGDESSAVNFSSLSDARVRKLKGARDAGVMALTVGKDAQDDGQNALKAAEKTSFQYNFKVELLDAPEESYSNTIFYFRGLVMSARDNIGANDNVIRTTFNIGINSAILEVPSAPSP